MLSADGRSKTFDALLTDTCAAGMRSCRAKEVLDALANGDTLGVIEEALSARMARAG
jgi:hypothetical protein